MEISQGNINLNKTPSGSSQNLAITEEGDFAVTGVVFSHASRDLRLRANGEPFPGHITVYFATSSGEAIASLALSELDNSERTVYFSTHGVLHSLANSGNPFEIQTDDVIGDAATVRVTVLGHLME